MPPKTQRNEIKMSERRSSPDKDRGRQNVVVGDLVQMCHTNPDL